MQEVRDLCQHLQIWAQIAEVSTRSPVQVQEQLELMCKPSVSRNASGEKGSAKGTSTQPPAEGQDPTAKGTGSDKAKK